MILIITVLFGMFCAAMEALITATILPRIISDLGGLELYPWIVNSFLISFIVFSPIYGRMSDTYGYKKAYLFAVSVFLISSMLCGVARDMVQLIVFRGLQGVGTGGLITMSIIFFGELFPLEKRPKMQALLSSMWAVASILGPAIGALFVQHLTWRWAFYINVPLGLLILISISIFAKAPPKQPASHPIDYLGLVIFILTTGALVFGLIHASQLNFNLSTYLSLGVGIGGLNAFILYSYNDPRSFIPFRLFKRPLLRLSIWLGFFAGVFLFSIANFLPLYLQGALGKETAYVSKVVSALALGSFSGALLGGFLLNRLGFRRVSSAGAVVLSLGFFLLILSIKNPSLFKFGFCNYLIGMGISGIANASIIAAQAASPKEQLGSATALFHFFRSFGGLTGIAVFGGLQLGAFRRRILEQASAQVGDGVINSFLQSPQQIFDPLKRRQWDSTVLETLSGAMAESIEFVFYFCFILGILTLFFTLRMPRKKPRDYTYTEDPIPFGE